MKAINDSAKENNEITCGCRVCDPKDICSWCDVRDFCEKCDSEWCWPFVGDYD